MCIIVIAGGGYYCCYYCAAGSPHRSATQTEWKVNLQPGRVLQARAKAEEHSLKCVCVCGAGGRDTDMTPSILGNSFSEKRKEPLDFIHHGMARGTVMHLGFPTCQGSVNMLILVMGTANPGHCGVELASALQSVWQERAALTWLWGMNPPRGGHAGC